MSFLYPLFLAGLATIGLPILLHMIRRYTRKRVTFSSLMFLRTTVPRWRNRGRLENLPLLVLRCVMLGLLAFGFSRPFFLRPSAQNEAFADLGRRIVLLIDTSASMRRAGLFPRAVSEAQSLLQGVRAADRVCVMSFDQSTRRLLGFEEWGTLDPAQRALIVIEHISKLSPSWARTNLGHALVTAVETIQDDETENFQFPISNFQFNRVVLISDLQQGSFLDELQAYQWPKDIELVVKPIAAKGTTNVSMQLVTSRDLLVHPAEGANRKSPIVNGKSQMAISDKRFAISDAAGVPIRITNSPDATKERFKLSWVDTSAVRHPQADNQKFKIRNSKFEISDDVYVPAGHSTVVRVPLPADMAAGSRLILTGDDHDFDNNLYLAPYCQQQVNILYVGTDDANDPQGTLYYVKRAFDGLTASKVRSSEFGVQSSESFPRITVSASDNLFSTDIATVSMVILAPPLVAKPLVAKPQAGRGAIEPQPGGVSVRRYLKSGGTVLLVMKSPEAATIVAALAGIETIKSEEADIDKYAMLSQIDFKHPLLAPFCEPRFGDFTKIAFWKYRRINISDLPSASVLAWFDPAPIEQERVNQTNNKSGSLSEGQLVRGDPALFELHIGKGSLLVLTSGWDPSDSNLALSSKFVPLLYLILEYAAVPPSAGRGGPSQYFVGDNVLIPHPSIRSGSANLQIRKPDGSLVSLDAGQQTFMQTDIPGIYTIESPVGSEAAENQFFAVNLPEKECQTASMSVEDLEMWVATVPNSELRTPNSELRTVNAEHRTLKAAALENEQKVWRWVFIALLGVSLIEISMAGWLTRSPSKFDGG